MLDFTELYKVTNYVFSFSPSGSQIATAVDHRLVVRDYESLQLTRLFTCPSNINYIQFRDEKYILVSCSGVILVFSDGNDKWDIRIDQGIAGLSKCLWSPCGQHIFAWSELALRITIWTVEKNNFNSTHIKFPKYSDRSFDFRPDGRYFCYAERLDNQDYIGIVDVKDLTLVKQYPVETNDLENLKWSPDGASIAIWDKSIFFRMLIYSPDGRLLKNYSLETNGLGIKNAFWSPTSQFLAITSFDNKIRLLNFLTWNCLLEFDYPLDIPFGIYSLWKEIDYINDSPSIRTIAKDGFENIKSPHNFTRSQKNLNTQENDLKRSKVLGICEWNCDGSLIASINDHNPSIIYVYDIFKAMLDSVIYLNHDVISLQWSPLDPESFAFITSNRQFLYLWSKKGPKSMQIPSDNFNFGKLKWCSDAKSLVLLDREKFCVVYLTVQ